MDARQRELVRSTFDRLRPIPKGLGLLFYGRLFQLDPSLRSLFSENLENQEARDSRTAGKRGGPVSAGPAAPA